jgi:hypothetical protein
MFTDELGSCDNTRQLYFTTDSRILCCCSLKVPTTNLSVGRKRWSIEWLSTDCPSVTFLPNSFHISGNFRFVPNNFRMHRTGIYFGRLFYSRLRIIIIHTIVDPKSTTKMTTATKLYFMYLFIIISFLVVFDRYLSAQYSLQLV